MSFQESKSRMPWRAVWVGVALMGASCEPVAEGDVRVTMSGGDGTQRGYPSHLFQDGWSVQFTKYLVSLGDFTLTSATGETRTSGGHVLVDVQKGDMPLTGMMRERGYSYWVEGMAVKGGVGVYTFRMGFPVDARMVDCVNGVDGTLGIVVPESSVAEAEVTIHAEHMFYDRLGTHRGVELRFDAFAASADAERVITPEGLAGQRLLDLRGPDGGELKDGEGRPVVYEPGAYTVRTLQEFVTRSVVDQAHLNGGGVCTVAH